MPREISAGAVIFRREPSFAKASEGKILYLLLHYQAGHWDFPKGNVEQGEKEEETIKREVAEETGIKDIKIIEGFKEYIKYFYRKTYGLEKKEKKKVPWTFKIVTYYLAETKTKEVKVSFEHLGYEWLPYEKALEKITYKNVKEILKKAHKYVTSR